MKKQPDNVLELTTVSVRVHPALREYLLAINNNSDIIFPKWGGRLQGLLAMYLTNVPSGYKPAPISGRPDEIRIVLHNGKKKTWSYMKGRIFEVNPLFIAYITDTGQRVIADHLMDGFKQTFRAYMEGALGNNTELSIKEAIEEFCNDYSIELEHVTYDMLRKDWYRYRARKEEDPSRPLIYTSFV